MLKCSTKEPASFAWRVFLFGGKAPDDEKEAEDGEEEGREIEG